MLGVWDVSSTTAHHSKNIRPRSPTFLMTASLLIHACREEAREEDCGAGRDATSGDGAACLPTLWPRGWAERHVVITPSLQLSSADHHSDCASCAGLGSQTVKSKMLAFLE